MRLQDWSKRTLIGATALWIGLILIYVTLGFAGRDVLPAPYNLLVMLTITLAIVGSGGAWLAQSLADRAAAAADAADVREGRIYYAIASMSKEAARLRQAIEDFPTIDLSRYPAAVGGYDEGFADGLARTPMREAAKVIPMSPREG